MERHAKSIRDCALTAKDRKQSTKEEMDTQDTEDTKLYQPGELLSCDNVGPVNPKSVETYTQTFIWRDTATKRMFSHSDSEAIEEVYLDYTTRPEVSESRSSGPTTSQRSSLGRYATTTPSTA